ncbi:hypothetical protein BH10BAC1_BH10BAC1_01710 [soil metagenome]
MKRKIIISVLVILTFFALNYLKYFFRYVVFGEEKWIAMDFNLAISYLNYTKMAIVLIVTFLLFKRIDFGLFGLKKDVLKGFVVAIVCVLPMFLGYGYAVGFKTDITYDRAHMDLILAGFYEEFMFRGFLFGILFYYAGWGFVSAVLIPSILFGIGHLYQADTLGEGVGVFLFTALGGAGFAWFYVAWRSLWMVAFLHGLMDLCWDMFSVQSNVTGNLHANVFRFLTLGLAIFFSIRKAKAENSYSLKGKLWLNKEILS